MVTSANTGTAWSTQLLAELDMNDKNAQDLTAELNVEQVNWRPSPGSWSIGQCLEHLCLGNEAYLPAISAALKSEPASPVQEITPGWFARWFIRSFIEPSQVTKRASAPKKIAPGRDNVPLSIVERFLSGNQEARRVIRQAEAYDVNRIRFVNPFLPLLRFTVGTGLKLTCGH